MFQPIENFFFCLEPVLRSKERVATHVLIQEVLSEGVQL